MKFLDKSTIKLDKIENELDKLVLDFVKILEKHTKYVIVSGYVAILFGRARATEDIGIFTDRLKSGQATEMCRDILKNSYYCLNSDDIGYMHGHLEENLALRFAKKGTIIPNFELKFAKDAMSRESLGSSLKVILPSGYLFLSPIELQIAYKRFYLKSEKDMEDAEHLERLFEGRLDKNLLFRYKTIIERNL